MNIFSKTLWEGPYVDLWSISHILFGLAFAFIVLFLFRKHKKLSLVYVAFFATLWEFIEHLFGVLEFFTNRVADVVLSVLAAAIVLCLDKKSEISNRNLSSFVIISLLLFIFANVFGWLAYLHYR